MCSRSKILLTVVALILLPFVAMAFYSVYYHARYETYSGHQSRYHYVHDRWTNKTVDLRRTIVPPSDFKMFVSEKADVGGGGLYEQSKGLK